MAQGKNFQVRLSNVTASYVKRWEPAEMTDDNDQPTGKLNYGCELIIEKSDPSNTDPRKCENLKVQVKRDGGWKEFHLTKVIEALMKDSSDLENADFLRMFQKDRLSLRDGDEYAAEKPDDREFYKGKWFIRVSDYVNPEKSSSRPHGVVSKDIIVKDGKKQLREITSDDEYYSGCIVVAAFAMVCNTKNSPHKINSFLNNVMVVGAGERLGGSGSNANDDFMDMGFCEEVDESELFEGGESSSKDDDDLLG